MRCRAHPASSARRRRRRQRHFSREISQHLPEVIFFRGRHRCESPQELLDLVEGAENLPMGWWWLIG